MMAWQGKYRTFHVVTCLEVVEHVYVARMYVDILLLTA